MNKKDIDNPVINQSLLNVQPDENASLDEWRDWALRLGAHLTRKIESETQNRQKQRELRKELNKKNKVLGHYKKRIRELEDQTETDEFDLLKWLRSLFKFNN